MFVDLLDLKTLTNIHDVSRSYVSFNKMIFITCTFTYML